MSGRVFDEFGDPVAGASVSLEYRPGGGASYPPSDCRREAQVCSLSTRTDANGEYLIAFDPAPDRRFPGHVGFAYAGLQGYESDVQLVPAGAPAISRNFRLRWSWVISAGESISLSVDAGSSRCHDSELFFVLPSRCESIYIKTNSTGTLVIEARATAAGGSVPAFHYWDVTGMVPGAAVRTEPGVLSLPVRAGTHRIKFGVPDGLPPQRFEVVTSLR